jgi:hypothetical protein
MATYEKAILTHIDILGFSDLINKSTKDAGQVVEIARTLRTIKSQMSEKARITQRSGSRATRFVALNFSDLTVRVSYLNGEQSLLDSLDWELFYLATKQCALTLGGTLLRGGISLDNIYVEASEPLAPPNFQAERIIFGPALVQAYELESKTAVFPRIAIDPDLMTHIHQSGGKVTTAYYRRGEDGVHFVDYLRATCDSLDYTIDDVDDTLRQHRDLAIAKLEELRLAAPRTRQKALWLALYHNSTVKLLREPVSSPFHGENKDDILATPSAPLEYESLLIPDDLINEGTHPLQLT